jgi:metallo-beta-lactamase class B
VTADATAHATEAAADDEVGGRRRRRVRLSANGTRLDERGTDMRRSARIGTTGLLFLLACATAPTDSGPTVKLTLLRGPVYVAENTFYLKENSLVYVGERDVTVVGATWTPETAKLLHREIRKATSLPVRSVVLTNHHPDRAGGADYWTSIGAETYATERTKALLERNWDALLAETRKAFPDYPSLKRPIPTIVVDGDFSLQEGRVRTLYFGPSHTDDGVFVHLPEERVLYGGCILKEHLGNLAHANVAEYPRTLARLRDAKLEIETIVAGHWSPVHGPELLPAYMRLLERRARASGSDP